MTRIRPIVVNGKLHSVMSKSMTRFMVLFSAYYERRKGES
jgi:hypothetical protein